jgi:hypothetical protein
MSNRFDYVKYDGYSITDQETAKALVQRLEALIETTGKGRSQSLALTSLEECYMWVGKAIRDSQIERNKKTVLQEERTNS